MNVLVGVQRVAEALHRLLPLVVLLDPVRVALGLAQRLLHVRLDPLGRDHPRSHQGLEQEVTLDVVRGSVRGTQVLGDGEPSLDMGLPFRRHRGQRSDACPHVGRALGVVGHGGQQVEGEALRALGVARVEALDVDPEARRIAAHVVQGDQPVVAIEGGVLDALGHDRRRGLLEAGDEARRRRLPEQEGRGKRGVHAGLGDRAAVLVGHAPGHWIDIRSVHRHGRQRALDLGLWRWRLRMRRPQRQSPRAADGRRPARTVRGPAGASPRAPPRRTDAHRPETCCQSEVKARLAGGVHEQRARVVEELVADGPGHRPVAQPLAGVEDLLDPDALDTADPGDAASTPPGRPARRGDRSAPRRSRRRGPMRSRANASPRTRRHPPGAARPDPRCRRSAGRSRWTARRRRTSRRSFGSAQ